MSLCWFFLETDQVPCSTTTAASASTRKAVIRVDVALATDWLHQTNLPSQTQIRQNIRLYYSVRRQGRKALKVSLPISPPWLHSCGMYKYDSCVSSKLWPTYFFFCPSIQHALTAYRLMFVKDDVEKSFVFRGRTSLCGISSHLCISFSCTHHRLWYWWTLVWGAVLTLYRHVPAAHNVSLFLMLTQ